MLKGRSLLEPMDFSLEELEDIFALAKEIMKEPAKYIHVADGKLLATLFYEPSTRTRFSFEAAMLRLGGQVIGFSEANSSSAAKGESIADTVRTVGCYADLIVMRHPKEGAPRIGAGASDVPMINAGDGGHQHPTQTLTDLLTIQCDKGRLDNLTIGICGDLKFGRTVHSLMKAMSRYKNIRFILISPEELMIPDYVRKEVLEKNNIFFEEVRRLEEAIDRVDVLYMTRVQKERFFNEEDYVRLKDSYILDAEKMEKASKDMIILHPLPRVNEIAVEVDKDPRALYFEQAKKGMFVRMALIMKLLGIEEGSVN
ncbi:MAG: aspartate carbamoyltransferase [Eubacteriales bacterium]|nr:aspartate carbamoyltransferase [Eubacteriales bacterium]MDD3350613.1 aspartate carbamoyltransferase [Eubacteriales bacterium]